MNEFDNVDVDDMVLSLTERVWFNTTEPVKRTLGFMAAKRQTSIAYIVRSAVLSAIYRDPVTLEYYDKCIRQVKEQRTE